MSEYLGTCRKVPVIMVSDIVIQGTVRDRRRLSLTEGTVGCILGAPWVATMFQGEESRWIAFVTMQTATHSKAVRQGATLGLWETTEAVIGAGSEGISGVGSAQATSHMAGLPLP